MRGCKCLQKAIRFAMDAHVELKGEGPLGLTRKDVVQEGRGSVVDSLSSGQVGIRLEGVFSRTHKPSSPCPPFAFDPRALPACLPMWGVDERWVGDKPAGVVSMGGVWGLEFETSKNA